MSKYTMQYPICIFFKFGNLQGEGDTETQSGRRIRHALAGVVW